MKFLEEKLEQTFTDKVYVEIFDQAENFKKYRNTD